MKAALPAPAARRPLPRALKVDLQRSILSAPFLLLILMVLGWLFLNVALDLTSELFCQGYLPEQMLDKATTGFSNFSHLLLIIAPTAYGWSYCQDRSDEFYLQAVRRVGVRAYGLSKIIATALSAFLGTVIALSLFYLYLCHAVTGTEGREFLTGGADYLNLVAEGHTGLYLFVRFTITGLSYSLAAVFGLTVTAWLSNVYLAFLSPIMMYYLWEILPSPLPLHIIGLIHPANFMFNQPIANDATLSFFISAGALLLMISLCGWLFCRKLRKEQSR